MMKKESANFNKTEAVRFATEWTLVTEKLKRSGKDLSRIPIRLDPNDKGDEDND